MLLLASLSFFSVRNQSLSFVDACHYRRSDGFVFCEIKYLFDALIAAGSLSRGCKLYGWFQRWKGQLVLNGTPPGMLHVGSKAHGVLSQHAVESQAVVALLAVTCMANNVSANTKRVCMRYLVSLVTFNLGTDARNVAISGLPGMRVLESGILDGWADYFANQHHEWYDIWRDMQAQDHWGRKISSTFHSANFVDVLSGPCK